MSDDGDSGIADDEKLARFVVVKEWVRADKTIRPDAFIPPKDLNLSVTRHLGLTEEELWRVGFEVAEQLEGEAAILYGSANVKAEEARRQNLKVCPHPLPRNPQHAHVFGWPMDKAARKNIAQELALLAKLSPAPSRA